MSFFAGAVGLLDCATSVLPEEGAVAALEAVLAEEEGLLTPAAAVEGLVAGREVGAVAGLEVLTGADELDFVVADVPGFGAVAPVDRLSAAAGLVAGRVFFGVPFVPGLVPLLTAAAAGPLTFLSGALNCVLVADVPTEALSGFLGTVAPPGAFAEGAVGFLTGAVLLVGLTSFARGREVAPGLDPGADSVLDTVCFFAVADLGFAAADVPLTVAAVFEGAAAAGCCSDGGEVCSESFG